MNILIAFINFFLHLDEHLNTLIATYGVWVYGILFLIILAETGFVVTPFLPGDSLLFAAGAFAASGSFHIALLLFLLAAAAIVGDNTNYWIGRWVGPRVFNDKVRFLKKEHLERTQKFYEKYGGKTVILARFMPIIRTFAPFVAGIGKMRYRRFLAYSLVGGMTWISTFTLAGYFFGNIPAVKENFTIVIFVIILISVLPAVIEYFKHRQSTKTPKAKNISVAPKKEE